MKALLWSVLAAMFSLGSAELVATAIQARSVPTLGTSPMQTSSPDLIAQGGELFAQSCSHCHGDDASGDEGPDLHRLAISDARIATTIKNGIKGEMPAFAKKYDTRQVAMLTAYLRSLR